MGHEVCKIFIKKCIIYMRNDNSVDMIKTILQTVKPAYNDGFMEKMVLSAQ
jgi:hypothetical protein